MPRWAAASPGMMTPTVTYLGMVVAYDLGARSNVAPAMVIATSSLLFLTGSSIVGLVPKAMFAAILVSSGLSMLVPSLASRTEICFARSRPI
eukprot:7380147-Prymnesium_polylepis.3